MFDKLISKINIAVDQLHEDLGRLNDRVAANTTGVSLVRRLSEMNQSSNISLGKAVEELDARVKKLEDSSGPPTTDPPGEPSELTGYKTGGVNGKFNPFSVNYNPFSQNNLLACKINGRWVISDNNGRWTDVGSTHGVNAFMWADGNPGDKDAFWWINKYELNLVEIDDLDARLSTLRTVKAFNLPKDIAWKPGNESGRGMQYLVGWQGPESRPTYWLQAFSRSGLRWLINTREQLDLPSLHNTAMTDWGYSEDPSLPPARHMTWNLDGSNRVTIEPEGAKWSHPAWDGDVFVYTSTDPDATIVRNASLDVLAQVNSTVFADMLGSNYANAQHYSIHGDRIAFSVRDRETAEISLWVLEVTTQATRLIVRGLHEANEENWPSNFYDSTRPCMSADGSRIIAQTNQGPRVFAI